MKVYTFGPTFRAENSPSVRRGKKKSINEEKLEKDKSLRGYRKPKTKRVAPDL